MASPSQSPMSFSPPGSGGVMAGANLPQSQVDAIIRTKRKARQPKACYPCHARKVKCDRNLPCDGCVKRDHAELCTYERPLKKRVVPDSPAITDSPSTLISDQIGGVGGTDDNVTIKSEFPTNRPGNLPAHVSISREEWEGICRRLRDMENTISNLRVGMEKADEVGHIPSSALEAGSGAHGSHGDTSGHSKSSSSPEREGIHAANTLGEGTVHLGSRSVLAYILNNKSGSDQLHALLEGGILPKLGLDNESATYPFVDLWSSDMSSFDTRALCSALPTDKQCKELVVTNFVYLSFFFFFWWNL